MNSKAKRRSGMELLRIYAIIGVIVLHYFNAGIGGGSNYVNGTLSVFVSYFFLTFAYCAVDLFVMISAYFLSASAKRSCGKIVFLLFEVSVVRVVLYIVNAVMNGQAVTATGIVTAAISYGYFIIFYSIVYFISPLINIGFERLDKKNSTKAMTILFVTFSVIPAIAAFLQSQGALGFDWTDISTVTKQGSLEGYTIVNFVVCYLLGWYIRHWHNEKKKRSEILLLFALNTLSLMIWSYIDWQSAYTYDNPLVLLEAAFLILLFKDFDFNSRVINEIATSGFMCYLAHSFFLLRYGQIEKYASQEWYVLLIHIVITCVLIYLICYVIHKGYSLLTNWFIKRLTPVIDKKVDLSVLPRQEGESD